MLNAQKIIQVDVDSAAYSAISETPLPVRKVTIACAKNWKLRRGSDEVANLPSAFRVVLENVDLSELEVTVTSATGAIIIVGH